MKQGCGIFEWPDGRKYVGMWHEGKQHGNGVYISPSGNRREGEWSNGELLHWLVNVEASDGQAEAENEMQNARNEEEDGNPS